MIFAVSTGVRQGPAEAVFDAALSVLALALPFVAGLTVRALGRRTATLETEHAVAAANAAEEERRRIARELHDIISHGLGLVVLQAGVADQVLDRDPDRAREALALIRQTGQEVLGELSTLVGLIREDPATSADPQPTLADIVLRYLPSNLEIEIVDDGREAQRGSGGRHGLPGLREGVAVFGGRLEAGGQPAGGWRLRASFPTTP